MQQSRPSIHIVWFKRDLRLQDHAALQAALQDGIPVLLLYIFEPSVRANPDWSDRHAQFVYASLKEMQHTIQTQYQGHLYWFFAEAPEVFAWLYEQFDIKTVFSHQETGARVTYDRDLAMKTWFDAHQIQWVEFPTAGVIRGSRNREGWGEYWQQTMEAPQATPDWSAYQPVALEMSVAFWFDYKYQKLFEQPYPHTFQPAGETAAHRYLQSFLKTRGAQYTKQLAKPEESRKHCSRLSPYLAWGNLSTRQVYQAYLKAHQKSKFKRDLDNFRSRLQWRCHFMQKFEAEDRIEFESVNRGYQSLEQPIRQDWLDAWKTGQTGYPLIDACMRCLQETGYLNFRMRAMLVSFLTHILWQPWQAGVHHLAQLFLDYEPGIHYSQFQMQAGVTGINTVRVYNPVKQSKEQDAEGIFIKKWLPALKKVPKGLVHEPWKLTYFDQQFYNCIIGEDYPAPIVDAQVAAKYAANILWKWRKNPEVLAESKRILKKHVRSSSQKAVQAEEEGA